MGRFHCYCRAGFVTPGCHRGRLVSPPLISRVCGGIVQPGVQTPGIGRQQTQSILFLYFEPPKGGDIMAILGQHDASDGTRGRRWRISDPRCRPRSGGSGNSWCRPDPGAYAARLNDVAPSGAEKTIVAKTPSLQSLTPPPGTLRPRPAGLRPTAPPCRLPGLRVPGSARFLLT
jgi:hypothetical protein